MRYRTVIAIAALSVFSASAKAAVDTADKRASVLNMTGYVLPIPNSDIDAGDRAQLTQVYRGFEDAGAPAPTPGTRAWWLSRLKMRGL